MALNPRTVKVVRFTASCAALFSAGWAFNYGLLRVHGQANSEPEYSLVLETYNDVSGTPKITEVDDIAMSSDGVRSTIKTHPESGHYDISSRELVFPSGINEVLSDQAHVKSTIRVKSRTEWQKELSGIAPPVNCAWPMEQVTGRKTVEGQAAIEVTYNHTGDPLHRDVARTSTSASWTTEFDKRLRSFSIGRPSSSRFDPASSYQEVSPSDMNRAAFTVLGITKDKCPQCFEDHKREDAAYQQKHALL